MTNVIPVKFAARAPERIVEQIVGLDDLTDSEVVRLMIETIAELKKRSPRMTGHSQRDQQGRLWAMPAIMRAAQHNIDYIKTIVGRGAVQ